MSNDLAKKDVPVSDLKAFVENMQTNTVKTGCKLCNSPNRKEAESMVDRGVNTLTVAKWLVNEKNEDISYGAVYAHMNNHFKEELNDVNLRDFANRLSKWGALGKSDEALFNRYIDFFDMEATALGAMNSGLPLSERRRNNELILKFATVIAAYKEQLINIRSDRRPVELVITSLNNIIQVKLEGSSNPEVKKVLTDIIEELVKEIGDLSVDGVKAGKA
jgi:hypothetical protein